jgi:two-component system, NtrC family, sensor kinase
MKDKPVILVVDDQPQNIDLLKAYLARQGYEIVIAVNGKEALDKLSGNQIDLILLDVVMPGMDGFEVTRRVRQDETLRLIPIILVSALREREDRVKGIEAGCDDFISKPVDKMELLARVRSLLKVKAYNDLTSNYQKELESEVTRRTAELKDALENLQRDITERKKIQSELQIKNLELIATYKELREKQTMIIQQEKMASIGLLAAGVAHEIKNPLAIILQGINYLQSTVADNPSIIEVVEKLNKAVLRADLIVKGLLSYSRQNSLSLDKQDILTIIDESLSLTEHEFHKKNLQLIRQYVPDLPKVSVDANQIKQVFINLLINGIDAMSEGGTFTINVKQIADTDNEKLLEISFNDTGQGIPEDKINKIFDPFYTTKAIGNTGLGLSISRGIIDRHGGTIHVESKIGQGTNMIIKLPIPL